MFVYKGLQKHTINQRMPGRAPLVLQKIFIGSINQPPNPGDFPACYTLSLLPGEVLGQRRSLAFLCSGSWGYSFMSQPNASHSCCHLRLHSLLLRRSCLVSSAASATHLQPHHWLDQISAPDKKYHFYALTYLEHIRMHKNVLVFSHIILQ